MYMFLKAAFRAFLDPGLYFGHVQNAVIMLLQQREFLELLRYFRFTFTKPVVEQVKERHVGIRQLQKTKKIESMLESQDRHPPSPSCYTEVT